MGRVDGSNRARHMSLITTHPAHTGWSHSPVGDPDARTAVHSSHAQLLRAAHAADIAIMMTNETLLNFTMLALR